MRGPSGLPGPTEVCLELHLSHVLGSLPDWGRWEPSVSSPGPHRAGWVAVAWRRVWARARDRHRPRAGRLAGCWSPALSGPSPKGRWTVRIQLLLRGFEAGGPLRWGVAGRQGQEARQVAGTGLTASPGAWSSGVGVRTAASEPAVRAACSEPAANKEQSVRTNRKGRLNLRGTCLSGP